MNSWSDPPLGTAAIEREQRKAEQLNELGRATVRLLYPGDKEWRGLRAAHVAMLQAAVEELLSKTLPDDVDAEVFFMIATRRKDVPERMAVDVNSSFPSIAATIEVIEDWLKDVKKHKETEK